VVLACLKWFEGSKDTGKDNQGSMPVSGDAWSLFRAGR